MSSFTVTSVAKTQSNNNCSTSNNTPTFLDVIDPCNRTGKVTIPMQYIQETRGMNELTRPKDAKDLSLCLLFQKGRCNAGARCHQIHADPSFVAKLRNQASSGQSCCALHGDFNSSSYVSAGLTVDVCANGATQKYSLQAFGKTQTMDSMITGANNHYSKTIRVNSNKVCRLHSQSRCKFGKDCKNIHMCPNAKPLTQAEVPAPITGFSMVTKKAPSTTAPMENSMSSSSTGPLGSAYLNTANRQMKHSPPALEMSGKSDFGSSANSVSFGLSTVPNTPSDPCSKSTRSVSESNSNNGLSPALSPDVSPKEKPFSAGGSLFNRNCSNSATTSPAPESASPLPTARVLSFASGEDAVFVSRKKAISPMTVDNLAAAMTATMATAAPPLLSWNMPLQTSTGSTTDFSPSQFGETMSLVAQDLAELTCSPMTTTPQWAM